MIEKRETHQNAWEGAISLTAIREKGPYNFKNIKGRKVPRE